MERFIGKVFMTEENIRTLYQLPDDVLIKTILVDPETNDLQIILNSTKKVEGYTYENDDYYRVKGLTLK
ncbi:hypothetical protein IFU39_00245 [Paenibacillus sp. CFBP 13594]|uniref:hypothetical protein n=1 Tax=Paenibacillus sp. CFBP 13594 TaxID=2774037 RepID=UPI0017823747|nr:hypothetical protein [Paenibacillus sp. CFBP 13594]MBD8836248.1 hypothetical protein [Paenibacillus sp. CFBP 13594]